MIDNPTHRTLFALPAIHRSEGTTLAVPELPPQHPVTGDKEVDAVIWLRSVIGTGQLAIIAKAKEAAARIKTPLKELEKRYSAHLARTNGGHMFATLPAIGFADLDGWEKKSIELAARRDEAHARFGDTLFKNTEAETFCEDTLAGVNEGRDEWELDKAEVDARFDGKPDQRPATLFDCLAELKYWTDLYWLRNAIDRGRSESGAQAQARKDYAFRCLGRILPRSTEEAHQVLQYLIDDNAMGWAESHGILMNLMTQPTTCQKATGRDMTALGLQNLRHQLHPELQQMYPELLTAVAPPTRHDILDLMVKLDAITCTGRVVPEFAMEVISGLVAMIDVERLA